MEQTAYGISFFSVYLKYIDYHIDIYILFAITINLCNFILRLKTMMV